MCYQFRAILFSSVLILLLGQSCSAFDVKLDGRSLPVHPVRVSAFPMNQLWPGYQRPEEQTEVAGFVSFDMDRPVVLTICPNGNERGGEPVVLPLSWKPKTEICDEGLRIEVDRPRQFVVSFGRDAVPLHVFANPPFVRPSGANVRTFDPGEHHVGTLCPRSGETIVIDEGAVVYGNILVAHAENVKVTGRGIVDCSYIDRTTGDTVQNRAYAKAGFPPCAFGEELSVSAFTCAWSTNVTVEGVVFRDSPQWTMNVRAQSRNVTADNVKIFGWRYNSDGFSAGTSENVTIRNSFIRSFDDCLVAHDATLDKGVAEGPTRNFLAENCVLWCDWGLCMRTCALYLPALVENVRFRDIAVIHVGGHSVCDVTTFYGSSDSHFRKVSYEGVEVDFSRTRYRGHMQKSPTDTAFPRVKAEDVELFRANVWSYGRYTGNQRHEPATDLSGFRVRYEDLVFRDFRVFGDVPRLTAKVDASTAPHTIDGLTVEGMPASLELVKNMSHDNHTEGESK